MHMGLEDGEPICPEALNLTEKSKQKIKNIALTTHLELKDKYEFLETIDLELMTSEDDLTSEDVMQKVENFLDDIEAQKKKDEEQFELLRAGAIDDIFAEFINGDTNSLMTTSLNSESIIEAEEPPEDEYEVSVQGVKSLGGHFACLCREFDSYEVFFFYYFSKRIIIFIVKSLQKSKIAS